MKGKMKKIIAGIATLAMAAQFAFVLPASAEATMYYSHDFESDSDTSAWTSPNYADGMALATDHTKYFQYTNGSGRGQRSAYMALPDTARKVSASDESTMTEAVLEFDFKTKMAGTKGDCNQIAFVSTTGNIAGNANYGGTDYVLILNQPRENGGNQIMVNEADDQGKPAATYSDSVSNITTGYENDTWAHAKATLDFTQKTAYVTITSIDGKTTYFGPSTVMMGSTASQLGSVALLSERNKNVTAIDNIVVRSVEDGDKGAVTYVVKFKYTSGQTEKTVNKSVVSGEKVDEVPSATDVTRTGYDFKGWYKDDDTSTLLTSADILAAEVSANTTYTAVYDKTASYIEPLESVQITTPNGGVLKMGEAADDFKSNAISVKLVGELGTDLYENKDSRTGDIDVNWTFEGFNTMVDVATGTSKPTSDGKDADGNDTCCDSYGKVIYDSTNPTVADFKLAKQFFNYYGRVKVSVTYGPTNARVTKTAEAPLAILASTASQSGIILPHAGYISDFNYYEDTMDGYKATTSSDNRGASDIVTGNWGAYGGSSGRGVYITKEGNEKFLRLKSTSADGSALAATSMTAVTDSQIVTDQLVRFHSTGAIMLKSTNPVTWTNTAYTVSFDGSKFTVSSADGTAAINAVGTETAYAAMADTWYNVVIISSVDSQKYYAILKDAETGAILGQSEVVAFEQKSENPNFYMFSIPNNQATNTDFKNVKMYIPEVKGSLTTTIANDVLSVPELSTDPDSTTTLTVSGVTTEDYKLIGKATWTVVDEPENVTVAADTSDTHNATLTVKNGAQAGDILVRVSLGGKTKDIPVTLSTSSDSVSFKKKDSSDNSLSPASISIPLAAGQVDRYTYVAEVVNKDGDAIEGHPVTYEVYDKNNANVLTTMPTGITFDKATGVLTVSSAAKAATFYIRATGTNTAEPPETISRSQKVTVHGLAFDFGTGTDGTVAEGYTAITPDTAYTESTGYGISSGTATAGGTGTEENPDADNLAGTFTFQAKVEPAKVYKVTVNYSGQIAQEYVNSDLTGIIHKNIEKGEKTYTVAVIDDILDISFANKVATEEDPTSANSVVSSLVIEKMDDKTANAKPHIYDVGDSTAANSGSWAYMLQNRMGNTTSPYKELAALASFTNNGRGGKNLSTYYTGGEFNDRVLVNIQPGDIMMIGNMGTNGMGNSFADDFNYYIDAAEKLGANIIINSYSPDGGSGYYNSSSKTFTGVRTGLDGAVKPIADARAESDPQYLGYVDLGGHAVDAFNAYVADYAANGYANEDAAAKAIYDCYSDHNHYSNAATACNLMLEGYTPTGGEHIKGTVEMITDILKNKYEVSSIAKSALKNGTETGDKAVTFTATGNTGNGSQTIKLIIAQYNATGALVSVKMQDGVFSKISNAVDVEFTPVADATVKAFAWDGMKPLLADVAVATE